MVLDLQNAGASIQRCNDRSVQVFSGFVRPCIDTNNIKDALDRSVCVALALSTTYEMGSFYNTLGRSHRHGQRWQVLVCYLIENGRLNSCTADTLRACFLALDQDVLC